MNLQHFSHSLPWVFKSHQLSSLNTVHKPIQAYVQFEFQIVVIVANPKNYDIKVSKHNRNLTLLITAIRTK